MSAMLPSRQLWAQGPHIVAIGGGTGLSTMLRGLKKYTKNLTAIVTVSDDGGGSIPMSRRSIPLHGVAREHRAGHAAAPDLSL